MPRNGHRGSISVPKYRLAGVSFTKLFELLAGAIAALNPALIGWSIALVEVISVAINWTMENFVQQTPKAQKNIIKLVEALRRRPSKP